MSADAAPLACNLDPTGARRRFRVGVGLAVATVLAGVALLLAPDASRWWRLALFPLAYGAGLGFLQSRARTWVRLASRGLREHEGRVERIADDEERRAARRRGLLVTGQAALVALLVTALAWLLPR